MATLKKSAGFDLAVDLGFYNFPSSIANLPAGLTINGQTVYPTFRYKGGDANGTNWVPWGYGETLTLQAGTAPSYNNGSPLLGSLDDSVKFNGGGGYKTLVDMAIGTEDYVLEFIVETSSILNSSYLWLTGASNIGIDVFNDSAASCLCNRIWPTGGGQGVITTASIGPGQVIHAMLFVDRSGSGQWYVNGVASGSASNISAHAASLNGGDNVTAPFANSTGATTFTGRGFLAAMWKQSNWLDTHLQATVAATRFAQLNGTYPQVAKGTALPTYTRASAAYSEKVESDGTSKLYYVGAGWPRVCSKKDSAGVTRKGYCSETSASNIVLQSQTFATTWVPVRATVPTTAVVCPDGITRTTCTLHEDATAANSHHIYQLSVGGSAVRSVYSVFVKAGARNFAHLYANKLNDAHAAFNLTTGACTYSNAPALSYGSIDCGNGWWRLWVSGNQPDTVNRGMYIYASSDGSGTGTSFDGLNQDSFYIFGAQFELGNYPSSYIPTTTAAVTRVADSPDRYSGSANFGVGKGSFQFKFLAPSYTPNASRYLLTCYKAGSSATNYITVYLDTSGYVNVASAASGGSAGVCQKATNYCDNVIHTITCSWQTNNLRLWVDGLAATPDTTCDFATDMDTVDIGADNTPSANNSNAIIVTGFKMNPRPNRWG